MKRLKAFLHNAILLALLLPALAGADMVVIVHPQCEAATLSRREVINIFMGRYRFFPSGKAATPLDLPAHDPHRIAFYQALTGRMAADIDAYWARLVLTGSASPPLELGGEEAMVERVARDPQAIGYVPRARADRRVRILLEPER